MCVSIILHYLSATGSNGLDDSWLNWRWNLNIIQATCTFPRVPPAKENRRCCASRLQTWSCKSKMRIWRLFKSRVPSSMLDGNLNVAVSPFELIHQKEMLPQVTSSNSNSLLSCNSINTPSTLTMGRRGSVCGWPLWSHARKDGRTGFSSAAPAAL